LYCFIGTSRCVDFLDIQDSIQIFLTWALPIENVKVGHALGIDFDIDPLTAVRLEDEPFWVNGTQANVCTDSGRWRQTG
jgi:hypothetical protein